MQRSRRKKSFTPSVRSSADSWPPYTSIAPAAAREPEGLCPQDLAVWRQLPYTTGSGTPTKDEWLAFSDDERANRRASQEYLETTRRYRAAMASAKSVIAQGVNPHYRILP
jgi:hypothetical protein